jgi:hypothetical protein
MTSTPDSLFESFRRAEMLVASSRPLDALQALLPGARRPARQRLGAAARGPGLPQLRPARAGRGGVHRVLELDPADPLRPVRVGQGAAAAGPPAEAHAQYKMAAAMDPRPEYQEALGEVRARMAALGG